MLVEAILATLHPSVTEVYLKKVKAWSSPLLPLHLPLPLLLIPFPSSSPPLPVLKTMNSKLYIATQLKRQKVIYYYVYNLLLCVCYYNAL